MSADRAVASGRADAEPERAAAALGSGTPSVPGYSAHPVLACQLTHGASAEDEGCRFPRELRALPAPVT